MNLSFARFVKRHHISRAALSLGVIAAAVVFFAAGAVLRLFMGPVSLGPLRGPISEALREAMPGISLQYDQAAVEWSREEGRINLVVLGARMFDSGGRIVAQAPKADIDMAAAPLLAGRFVVRRVTLVGVQLALVRLADGSVRLGVAADKGGDDIIARIREVISRSSGPSTLQSFAVREARLAIHDEPTGLFLVAPSAALNIRPEGEAIAAAFDAAVEISGRRAQLAADILIPPDDAPISGNFSVQGLDLRALAANTPKFAGLEDVALVADVRSRFGFGPAAKLAFAEFEVAAKGETPFHLYRSPRLHVNALTLAGRYDGAADQVRIIAASLDARELKARLSGQGRLERGADGALVKVTGDAALNDLTVAVPGLFPRAAGFSALRFAGGYDLVARALEVERAVLTGPGFNLEAAGRVVFEGETPGIALKGSLGQIPVRSLMNYWPLPAAPGAREWVAENIFAGTLGPATFAVDMAPGVLDQAVLPDAALNVAFSLHDVEANYLSGLTHLTGVAGRALLTGDDFVVHFSGGRVGNLTVSSGRAVIPELHKRGTVGAFTAHVTGAMPEIMTLIDMKPLNYPTRFGIEPGTTRGDAVVDLDIRVPMLSDVKVDDVAIAIKAAVKGFAVSLGRLRLAEGDVTFDINNDNLRQAGTVMLADQRFSFDWTEDFKTAQQVTTRVNARGLLTPAVREALNINLSKVMSGAWPVSAVITGHRGALLQAEAALDLMPAVITVPFINQGKAAGESASARVTVNFTPDGRVSDQLFRITGANVAATGTAIFNREGDLARLDFSNVRRGLTDLAFTLTRGPEGDAYDVRGRALDGSAIGRAASCNLPPGTPKPAPKPDQKPEGAYRVTARLDRLALCDGVSINNVAFDLAATGERPSALSLSGRLGGTAAINANLENTQAGRRVTVTTADAGLLARALFSFTGLRGGNLRIVANLPGRAGDADAGPGTPDFTGNLTMTDFQMVNQPFLARLFSSVSFTGIGDLLQNEGITMDSFEMPFSSKNNVVSISNAIFTGGVGGTAEGYIDRPKAQVEIKGSLVPAYGLNSIISNVPVIGDLLASKKGEGILGVTYSMSGPTDDMALSYNPLSMLAPGILRRIFEGSRPNAANAPSNQPAPPAGAAQPPAANAQAQQPTR